MFGTNESKVSVFIRNNLTVLYYHLQNFVQWPTTQEWSAVPRRWEMFPNTVRCIDGTLHEVNRSSVNQHLFSWTNFKHPNHRWHLQYIWYFKTGFQGHNNDAAKFLELLLTWLWMRHYPTNTPLATMFGTNESKVSVFIRNNLTVLYYHLQNFVQWPTTQEWSAVPRRWEMFPNTVRCIDGTLREIHCPSVNQHLFSWMYFKHPKSKLTFTKYLILQDWISRS